MGNHGGTSLEDNDDEQDETTNLGLFFPLPFMADPWKLLQRGSDQKSFWYLLAVRH